MKKIFGLFLVVLLTTSTSAISQDKSAFGKTVGGIYTPGSKAIKISGGYLSTRLNIFGGFEVHLNERIRGSITVGYVNDEHSEATRTLWPIYLEGGFKLFQVQNVLYFNVIGGIGNSFQTVGNFEPVGGLTSSVLSGIVGAELMLNVIEKMSFFVDLRQVMGVNDDNHQLIYGVGLKRKLRF